MSNIAKATFGLMVVTILSKILGFGRELVLGAVYGTSLYSDVYITSMNIPGTIFVVVGTAIATTFIPLYYENLKLGGEEKALKFVNNITNIVFFISILLCILGIVFAKPIVKVFAIGFEETKLNMTIKFMRIMMIGGMFIGISDIMSSFLQIKKNFIVPGIQSIPYNIIIIISIILSLNISVYMLPIGTAIAMMSKYLFQYPFSMKNGYKYKYIFDFKDEYIKKTIILVGPVLIGVAVNEINTAIDRALASTLVEGSISALNYANRLNGFVMAMFISSISVVVYPLISGLSIDNNKQKFKEAIVKSINSIIIFVIPISVGAIVLAMPIVKLLFQRGAFDNKATSMTAVALIFYSLGMTSFGLRNILGKVFYSLKDTKTPMINGVMTMILNIVINIILVRFMGHAGLAFATSISATICTFLLFKSLSKKIGYFGQDKIFITTIKCIISSIIMGCIVYYSYKLIILSIGSGFVSEFISLFVSIGIGGIVYVVMIVLLKVEEVNVILRLIKIKLKNNGLLVNNK